MIQQLTNELEQDESRVFRHHGGSPIGNSPPGPWTQFGSPNDKNSLQFLSRSPNGGPISPIGSNHLPRLSSPIGSNHLPGLSSPIGSNHLPGLSSAFPSMMSNSVKIAPIGKDQNRGSHADQVISNSSALHGSGYQLSHSFPDHSQGVVIPSPGNSTSLSSIPNASDVGTLSGPQFLWGNSTTHTENKSSWQPRGTGGSIMSNGQGQGQSFLYSNPHGSFLGSSLGQHLHHVGSAPSVVPFERQYGYVSESPETSFMSQFEYRNNLIKRNGGTSLMGMNPQGMMSQGIISGNIVEPNVRMMPAQRFGPMVFSNAPFSGLNSMGIDGLVDRSRSRRVDNQGSQADNKKLYQLDLEKIIMGEDTRTTIMIKNIPNKYTSKMLLAAIDETHKGTYDFLYLPIDFKNKCNVGYAFINMASPSHIVSFYEAFNGKRWEKFNSEKVASLAYARIQGRPALVAHFQNSSLMNEDKRCRPILFDSEGAEAGDQELFIMNIQDGTIPMRDSGSPPGSSSNEKSEKNTLPISITGSES
ncbi:protein MEI2-like 2 [Curcuma longa]